MITDFGFVWGPVEVVRATTFPRPNGDYHVIEIKTKTSHIDVYVSPSGRSVRVFRRGKGELK